MFDSKFTGQELELALNNAGSTVYIFIDDSGDLAFSNRGTNYFVMAAVITTNPIQTGTALQLLKYKLMAIGADVEQFHATEDLQIIRDATIEQIGQTSGVISHVIYGDKRFVAPVHQNPASLFGIYGKAMIRYMAKKFENKGIAQVVIVFDTALTKKQQSAFKANVIPELKSLKVAFHIYTHQMKSDMNGQSADYLAWSKFVQLSRGETRPWNSLNQSLHPTEFNIFQNGHTKYY